MPASYTITEGVQITQKIISISDVKGVDRYYDYNNYKAQLTGGILLGHIIGDDISFDLGEGVISSNNAGTHNVATSIVLTGKDAQNYHLIQPSGVTIKILPKPVEVIWESQNNYIYNAQDQSGLVKAYYLNDLGEKVYLRVSFDKTFKNAGLYFAFASMIETDGNYELYNTDKYFEIQLRQIEVYSSTLVYILIGLQIEHKQFL